MRRPRIKRDPFRFACICGNKDIVWLDCRKKTHVRWWCSHCGILFKKFMAKNDLPKEFKPYKVMKDNIIVAAYKTEGKALSHCAGLIDAQGPGENHKLTVEYKITASDMGPMEI